MKGIAAAYLMRLVGLILLLSTCVTPVEAQNCQALLQQILSGGANVAWAVAAQQEYNRNCLGQKAQPPRSNPRRTYNPSPPTPYQAPTPNTLPRKVMLEEAKLGEMINKGQPLRQNIPLSSGTKMMETVAAPPPAPANYVDPFAVGTFPAITKSTSGPVRPHGSIWDPSQSVTLSPPAAPSAPPQPQPTPSSGPCGPYAAQTGVCSAPVTGFGR